jgi:hypothetical protein
MRNSLTSRAASALLLASGVANAAFYQIGTDGMLLFSRPLVSPSHVATNP